MKTINLLYLYPNSSIDREVGSRWKIKLDWGLWALGCPGPQSAVSIE